MDINNSLVCNVSLKDTDLFKDIIGILKDVTEDKRISEDVREEYKKRIITLVNQKS